MSLSCTEPSLIAARPGLAGRFARLARDARKLTSVLKAGVAEATLSTHAASVMLRVVSSLALGFALVRLAKIYLA